MRRMVTMVSAVSIFLAATFSYIIPPGWQKQPNTSSMRVGEFSVPHADGDAEDAQLVIYYFGGSGGTMTPSIALRAGRLIGCIRIACAALYGVY
jgi:hypothetical protein